MPMVKPYKCLTLIQSQHRQILKTNFNSNIIMGHELTNNQIKKIDWKEFGNNSVF